MLFLPCDNDNSETKVNMTNMANWATLTNYRQERFSWGGVIRKVIYCACSAIEFHSPYWEGCSWHTVKWIWVWGLLGQRSNFGKSKGGLTWARWTPPCLLACEVQNGYRLKGRPYILIKSGGRKNLQKSLRGISIKCHGNYPVLIPVETQVVLNWKAQWEKYLNHMEGKFWGAQHFRAPKFSLEWLVKKI